MKSINLIAATSICTLLATGTAMASTLPEVAHRGLVEAGATENTRASVRDAVEAGYAAVEVDVRLTKDGRAVLLHDSTLDATTDCSGLLTDTSYARATACGVDSYYSTMEMLAGLKWRGTVFVHVKVKLSSGAATGLVKGARLLSNEERRVAFMIENDAERVALVKAGWDGRDEGKTHRAGAWTEGQMYGTADVERFVNVVHTATDWTLKGYQILLPISKPGHPGYDANVTKTRVSAAHKAGQKVVGFPDMPNPLEQLLAAGVDGLLLDV